MSSVTGKSPTTAPHAKQGSMIHAWRNEIKHSIARVARDTKITEEKLRQIESGAVKPTWDELEKLAKQFYVSVRDLLPAEYDLDRGMKFCRDTECEPIEQKRAGRLQYTYWPRCMTPVLPNFKPVELLLHLTKREEVIMNRGHFFHQYTQVLHGGPVAYLWEKDGVQYEEVFKTGDSWLIPGFVPHAFYSPDPSNLGRILAITFGQHLTGDAKQELDLIGSDNLSRIVHDELDYYPKGETKS